MKIVQKMAAKLQNNRAHEGVTIAFLGDSVTQGCFEIYQQANGGVETFYDQKSSYERGVCDILSMLYPSCPINVINAGISGDNAPGGLARVQRDVLRHQPDLCVVCYGLNDCATDDGSIARYTDALRVALNQFDINPAERNVLITHQFVTGAETCESEELSVGGTDNVSADVFEAFDYVALGHIHGPQNVGTERIRYCGTPLKYSFSEASHRKSVTLVELGEKGELSVSAIELVPRHDMREIRGTYEELSARSFYEGTAVDDYLHVILRDEEDVPEAIGRLRVIYPNIMKLSYDNARTRSSNVIRAVAEVQRKSQLDLLEELYELQNDRPMNSQQRSFAQQLIEEIWEDGR